MEDKNYTGIIPENNSGEIIDSVNSIILSDEDEAKEFFSLVKQRLLNVNSWNELSGSPTADFQLTDNNGNEASRAVAKGDYFKINIPGPGPAAGEGYDWAYVEDVDVVAETAVESVGIRVRPAPNPQNNSAETAHFFDKGSTSSFTVTREGSKITAGIHDRNIKPNQNADGLDKTRDMAVGLGAIAGFSKFQWDKLTQGILKKEK